MLRRARERLPNETVYAAMRRFKRRASIRWPRKWLANSSNERQIMPCRRNEFACDRRDFPRYRLISVSKHAAARTRRSSAIFCFARRRFAPTLHDRSADNAQTFCHVARTAFRALGFGICSRHENFHLLATFFAIVFVDRHRQ